jgi:phenylacetate-CoA ligase
MQRGLPEAVERHTAELNAPVAAAVGEAAARVPAFAARLAEAGIEPGAVRSVADLDALPVMTKDVLMERQHTDPPFGGLLAPDVRPTRLFQSPGPVYEPQLPGEDPWRWSQALGALGVGAGDTVLNCFSYHLSPAGAMFERGARALGATVVPGGVGALDLQARLVADLAVTAYVGLPSYLKALMDTYREAGHDPNAWGIERALVTAEPLPDSLRAELTARVARVHMAYGTAEAGLLAYEDAPGSALAIAEDVLVQVCELSTGMPIRDDRPGQVVVTLLRAEYPLVRFGTGDLSAWRSGPAGEPRLAGVLGRSGEAVKVRGMFLHPRQASDALAGLPGLADARFVVDRVDHRDVLRCEFVVTDGADPDHLATLIRGRVRNALRFDAEAHPVDAVDPDAPIVHDIRDWS